MNLVELLVSRVVDYAIFVLDADGYITTWNPGAERLKGYTEAEVVGRHFSIFYPEEAVADGFPDLELATAAVAGPFENEGWRVRKDGSQFWANVVITALRDDEGRLLGFGKVTRDLTQRKEGEDALRGVLERERSAADQLRSVDAMRRELVTMVAHDLRGPVSVIQHLLELLLHQWSELDDADRMRRVQQARDRADALGALTDDVFDLSLIDAGHLEVAAERIDVGAIAERAANDLLPSDDHDRIRVIVGPDGDAIGDHRRTWQVLTNLLTNALKYSPGDVPIEVAVGRFGNQVVITVRDGGAGIAAEDQERIFDRFTRLPQDDATPGSGLGLFIARRLAEAQGGTISVSSSRGEGATFRVTLPGA